MDALSDNPSGRREFEDSMLGSPRAIAARTSSCARCTAAAVVLALALSSPANAADMRLPVKAVPPLPIFSWAGLYVGADVGYVWVTTARPNTLPQRTCSRV